LTDDDEQDPNEISIEVDDSLYIFTAAVAWIWDVTFNGMAFARNSICSEGILFNVSSVSLPLPFSDADLDISYQYCVIPRQTKRILPGDDEKEFIQ
jgi:hypothetical protein